MSEKSITAQQKRFLTEYAECLDAQKAATVAGYKTTTAKAQAKALLFKEPYRRELGKIIHEKALCLDITKAYIIKKYLDFIEWAAFCEDDAPKDPALGLRALDGLCKQLSKDILSEAEDVLFTKIEGLNQERI